MSKATNKTNKKGIQKNEIIKKKHPKPSFLTLILNEMNE